MAVSISAMFKLVDQMSDRMDKIGSVGDKAMNRIESSSNKADHAFSKCQSSAQRLSAVYKNFEGNADQLANAVQRGEKTLSSMKETEGETAASTFEYSTKLDAATKAQENLEKAMISANTATENYETIINNSSTTADELAAAEEELNTATLELFEAFDKGAEAALDLEDASNKAAEKIDDFKEKSEEAGKSGKEFGDKTSNAIESLEQVIVAAGIAKLVKEITDALLDCAAASETVETSAAKLETLAGSQNMSMLSDQIYTISAATGEAQEGLYEVAYNAISAGTEIKKASEITEAATKLATAGFTTSSSALSVLTTAANSYGKAAGSATDITDGLITVQNLGVTTVGELANSMGKSISTAAAYNVSLNNLESAYISVTKAGINTQEGTTYINAMLNELGKSSSDVAKIITEETGKSFGELMTSGYSLADVLEILYNKAGKNTEAMMNLWGSQTAAVASAAIVNQGLDNFNSNLNTLQNSAGATAEAYSVMANTTEFAHNKMKNSADNLKIAVGNQLNPELEKFYKIIENLLDGSTTFVNQNPWVVKALTSLAVGIGVVTTGVTAATVATKLMTIATETLGITIDTALPILGLISAAIALLTFAIMNCSDETDKLTASSQAQADELERLNEQYDDAVQSYGESSEEAARLRYQIDDLNTSFENNKRTVGEMFDSIEDNYNKANETIQSYKGTIEQIDIQKNSVYGLIQKLEDLIDANDGTTDSEGRIKGVIEELNRLLPGLSLKFEDVTSNINSYVDIMKKAAEIKFENDKYEASLTSYSELMEENERATKDYQDALVELYKNVYEPMNSYLPTEKRLSLNDVKENWDNYEGPTWVQGNYQKAFLTARDTVNNTKEQIQEIENSWAEYEENMRYIQMHPADSTEAASNAIEKYKEEIESLCTAYGEAYNAALQSFDGQFSLFDEVITRSEEGSDKLTAFEESTVENAQKALDSQLQYWETYNTNIEKIKNLTAEQLGLSEVRYKQFMANIQDGSEEAAGLAQSMAESIDGDNTESVKKLAQTYDSVKEQQEKAAATIADWKTDFENELSDIEQRMEETVNQMDMEVQAKTNAQKTIQGYTEGIRSGLADAISAAKDVATGVANALNINLPQGTTSDSLSKSAGYAIGTDYAAPGVHLVGENGPELVTFAGGERVFTNSETEDILSRSGRSLERNIPASLMNTPSVTYSDSENSQQRTEKTINLNINGQGNIKMDGSQSKEEIVEVMMEYAKPIMMAILEDDIIEEGDESYEF